MVNAMFAVLIAGSIGYALSGWVGVAVGATVASAVAVLTEALSPPIERGTSHERRMRRDRRYRARYEAIEDGWRRPVPRSRRAWQPAISPPEEAGSRRSGVCPSFARCTRQAGAPRPCRTPAPRNRSRPARNVLVAGHARRSRVAMPQVPTSIGKSGSEPARRSESGQHKRAVKAAPGRRVALHPRKPERHPA